MSSLNACANADTTGSAVEEVKVSLPTADPTGKTLLLFLYDLSFTLSFLAVALMEVVNSSEKWLKKSLKDNDDHGTYSNNAWKKLVLNLILSQKNTDITS